MREIWKDSRTLGNQSHCPKELKLSFHTPRGASIELLAQENQHVHYSEGDYRAGLRSEKPIRLIGASLQNIWETNRG